MVDLIHSQHKIKDYAGFQTVTGNFLYNLRVISPRLEFHEGFNKTWFIFEFGPDVPILMTSITVISNADFSVLLRLEFHFFYLGRKLPPPSAAISL